MRNPSRGAFLRTIRILLVASIVVHGATAEDAPTGKTETVDAAAEDVATRRLLRAAAAGRRVGVERALAAGARIDENREAYAGPGRQTALVAAALAGHASVVKLLVEAGADPSVPEKDGFTVWHAAAFQGRASVLQVLDALGVPGDAASPADGYWPIHRAAWGRAPRHVRAVEILLERNSEACERRSPEGERPIDVAKTRAIRERLARCGERDSPSSEEAPARGETPGST